MKKPLKWKETYEFLELISEIRFVGNRLPEEFKELCRTIKIYVIVCASGVASYCTKTYLFFIAKGNHNHRV